MKIIKKETVHMIGYSRVVTVEKYNKTFQIVIAVPNKNEEELITDMYNDISKDGIYPKFNDRTFKQYIWNIYQNNNLLIEHYSGKFSSYSFIFCMIY